MFPSPKGFNKNWSQPPSLGPCIMNCVSLWSQLRRFMLQTVRRSITCKTLCYVSFLNNRRLPQHISCSSPYWCDHRAVPRECIRSSTRCPSEGKAWDTKKIDFWLKGPDPLIGFRYFVLQQRCDQKSTGKKEEQKNQSTFLLCFAKSRGIQIQLILYASNFF